ncbi:rhodanese-like domain-containing protein [Thalassotalea agarivorans]|uniref:Rhodanese-like domain-containing protein n=1 Tax=Thalassotalea agarivorans TaxID=349064 RepID=A0A1I0FIU1_THASX|nr:rhodanese-like domain-containing protein [Thalassotalea agarivorans]SET57955.1 Rhodanese-like domain-containing protein [Thalassotalea agarivorans]
MLITVPELVAKARENVNCVTAADTAAKDLSGALIVDVREPQEFAQGAVKGAINIPRGVLEMQMLNLHPNAEQTIYVHCATGGRATLAGEQLARIGYNNVHVITCKFEDIANAFNH